MVKDSIIIVLFVHVLYITLRSTKYKDVQHIGKKKSS